jgi:hypothetical protein
LGTKHALHILVRARSFFSKRLGSSRIKPDTLHLSAKIGSPESLARLVVFSIIFCERSTCREVDVHKTASDYPQGISCKTIKFGPRNKVNDA